MREQFPHVQTRFPSFPLNTPETGRSWTHAPKPLDQAIQTHLCSLCELRDRIIEGIIRQGERDESRQISRGRHLIQPIQHSATRPKSEPLTRPTLRTLMLKKLFLIPLHFRRPLKFYIEGAPPIRHDKTRIFTRAILFATTMSHWLFHDAVLIYFKAWNYLAAVAYITTQ